MNTTLIIILVALFTLILGFIIGTLISKLKTKQVVSDLEKEMSAIEINQSNMEVQKREIQNRLDAFDHNEIDNPLGMGRRHGDHGDVKLLVLHQSPQRLDVVSRHAPA